MSYTKGIATGVHFALVDTTTETPVTTGTPTSTISTTNTVAGVVSTVTASATTSTPTHAGSGVWILELTAAEMNFDTVFLLIQETGSHPVQIRLDTGVTTSVDAVEVIPELKHYCDGVVSRSVISLNANFAGTLSLVPDLGDATVSTVNSAALTGAASVTGTNLRTDISQREALYDVAALSTIGTYTATVSVTTTDSQTLVSTGTIIVT